MCALALLTDLILMSCSTAGGDVGLVFVCRSPCCLRNTHQHLEAAAPQVEARVREKTPYVVVALQEAVRMNTLLEEMRRSMEELLLGLDGALNMSDKMEKLAVGIATNSVPALWMAQVSTRYQEVYTLSSWYQVGRWAECFEGCLISLPVPWLGREYMLSARSPIGRSQSGWV